MSPPWLQKTAAFDVEGIKTAEFCAPHAEEEMVNVCKKRCAQPGCDTSASYGLHVGSKTASSALHSRKRGWRVSTRGRGARVLTLVATSGRRSVWRVVRRQSSAMDTRRGLVYVNKRKRCIYPGCSKHPSHGVEGSTTTGFCASHVE